MAKRTPQTTKSAEQPGLAQAGPEAAKESNSMPRRNLWVAVVAGAVVLFLAIYLLRLDSIVGLFVDDAWYALLSKSLATGDGYQLINSPSPGMRPVYPPGFPFLLSLAYRLYPHFPENVWLLKAVSILAMAGVGAATYRHFTRDREWPKLLSLVSALTVTMIPGLVFLATSSVMSECVFTLLQLLATLAIGAGAREKGGGRQWRLVALGGALAAGAFLTRSIGLALLAAGAVYLIKERLWKASLVFVGAVMLFAGPWVIYSRVHRLTPEQRTEQGGMIVQDYATQFWQRRAGVFTSGKVQSYELTDRLWANAVKIVGNNVAMIFTPTLFRSPKLSGEETLEKGDSTKFFSYILSLLILIGFARSLWRKIALPDFIVVFTLLITVAWPWDPYRFLLPLSPFLLYYLVESVRGIHEIARQKLGIKLRPEPWRAMAALAGCLLALSVFDHAAYLRARRDLSPAEYLPWRAIYDENRAVIDWLGERAPKDAVIASENPAITYLYTGRKSVAIDDPAGNWENWKRLNVRYMARLSVFPASDPGMDEGRFNMPFRSKGPLKLRVTDLGPKENRIPWSSFRTTGTIKLNDLTQ
jgi:hypothetical protein